MKYSPEQLNWQPLQSVTLNYDLFINPSSAKFIFYLVLITQFSPLFNPFSTSLTHFLPFLKERLPIYAHFAQLNKPFFD